MDGSLVPEIVIADSCPSLHKYQLSVNKDGATQEHINIKRSTSLIYKETVCSRHILKIQSAVHQFQSNYGKPLKRCLLGLLIAAYFAYFSYAMYYSFGDEASVRLLWVTLAVVLTVCWVRLNVWTRISDRLHPYINRLSDDDRVLISWIIGLLILLGTLSFAVIDSTLLSWRPYNLLSLTGLLLYLLLVFLSSAEPACVQWRTVLWGLNLQLLFALFVLRWHVGFTAISWLADRFNIFLQYADNGSRFVFGEKYVDHWFAFKAMPVVVFVSSIISVLYHVGVMQRIIFVIGWLLQKVMDTTAAESMAAAGNIFVGNTEAPLMILPLIKHMTRSELHCLMVGGFATIAGSAFGTFVVLGAAPNHLIAASLMSAPAALSMAKLSYPETEESKTTVQDLHSLEFSKCKSIVEAAATGAIQSIKLVANMTVNILAFLGILQLMNDTMTWMGHRVGITDPDLTFGLACSYLLFPFALSMGVELESCQKVAEILGIKAFINTAMAYKMLGDLRKNKIAFLEHIAQNGSYTYINDDVILYNTAGGNTTLIGGFLSARSEAITSFSLCGFASIDSIGIVLGALSALVPERKSDLAGLVVRAMVVGNLTSFMTASIAGLLFQGD